jgi:hypothetical protein
MAKDEADYAAEAEDNYRQEAMWQAQRASRYQHRGSCYNCGEACSSLFCDVNCRQDYEREQQVRKRQKGEGHANER